MKWAFQRMKKGWSERDVWSLDHYLNGILAGALLDLAKNRHGSPCRQELSADGQPKCARSSIEKCSCHEVWEKELIENAERFRLLYKENFDGDRWWEEEEKVDRAAWDWLKEWHGALWD